MSAIVIDIRYSVGGGDKEATPARFVSALERAGAEVANVGKHILPRVVKALEGATAKQFASSGGGPLAGNWAKLSTAYASWKARKFPGQPINVATGAMRAGLTQPGAVTARRDINGNSLAFGTQGVPYASVAQTGSAKQPARPPFDFGSDFDTNVRNASAEGLRAALKEADFEMSGATP